MEPKPCPFCGEQLELEEWPAKALPGQPIMKYWKHPMSLCYCSGFEVVPEDVPLWNRRAKYGRIYP